MSYEEKIERGLKLYLREVHGVKAIEASIGESEAEQGWEGCESCGYGSNDGTITTPISYKEEGDAWTSSVEIDGTSLNFLPTLLSYIDRAE